MRSPNAAGAAPGLQSAASRALVALCLAVALTLAAGHARRGKRAARGSGRRAASSPPTGTGSVDAASTSGDIGDALDAEADAEMKAEADAASGKVCRHMAPDPAARPVRRRHHSLASACACPQSLRMAPKVGDRMWVNCTATGAAAGTVARELRECTRPQRSATCTGALRRLGRMRCAPRRTGRYRRALAAEQEKRFEDAEALYKQTLGKNPAHGYG